MYVGRPAQTYLETISSSFSLSVLYGQQIGKYNLGALTLHLGKPEGSPSTTGRHVRCSTLTTLEDGPRGSSGSLLLELSRDSVSRADSTSEAGQTEGRFGHWVPSDLVDSTQSSQQPRGPPVRHSSSPALSTVAEAFELDGWVGHLWQPRNGPAPSDQSESGAPWHPGPPLRNLCIPEPVCATAPSGQAVPDVSFHGLGGCH